jgi:hypothetical protein
VTQADGHKEPVVDRQLIQTLDETLDLAAAMLYVHERHKYMAMGQKILQEDAVIAQPLWHSILSAITRQVRDYATHPSLYTISTVSGSCDVRQCIGPHLPAVE